MSVPTMNRHHIRVLEAIFAHPAPHNLEWLDVVSLIDHLGSAAERHDGKYEFQVGAAHTVITKPRHKDVGVEEIFELRRFLTEAGVDAGEATVQATQTIVLLDHRQARFFGPSGSGRLDEREHLEPNDPHGFRRHLEHRKEAHYKGERVPETDEFYERIAQTLKPAQRVVLIGDAAGKSSAMRYFVEFLNEKHKDLADRVVATTQARLQGITVGEIEQLVHAAEE